MSSSTSSIQTATFTTSTATGVTQTQTTLTTVTTSSTATSTASTTSVAKQYVSGVVSAKVENCSELQTPAGQTGLKQGIATAAKVSADTVSITVQCSGRRLEFLETRRLEAAGNAAISYVIEVPAGEAATVETTLNAVSATDMRQTLLTELDNANVQNVGIQEVSVTAAVSDTAPTITTTAGPTTTAAATTTTTTTYIGGSGSGSGSGSGQSGGDDAVLIVIIIVLCVVLIGCIAPVGGILYRNQVYADRRKEVQLLDSKVDEFEHRLDQLETQVDLFMGKYQRELGRGSSQATSARGDQEKFGEGLDKFKKEARAFLQEEYTPELLRRQPPLDQSMTVSKTSAALTGKPPDTLQSRVWPPMPATPPAVVRKQRTRVTALEKNMAAVGEQFAALVRQVFPGGLLELPNPGVFGAVQPEPVNPTLEQETSLLKPFTHPLLTRVAVKAHGVLGAAEGQKDVKPFTPIPAVIVDPAGWRYIGKTGDAKGAGGAAGAIYDWLGMKKSTGKFPVEVHAHFNTHTEEEAETRAKFFAYNGGMHVIHVVGPKIRDLQGALHDLSRTYVNVFDEFCRVFEGPASSGRPSNQVLRLLPVSSGIFLVNKKLDRYMAEITWSAISLAFGMMPTAQQDILRNSSIEVCIFKKSEIKLYEDSLAKKVALVADEKIKLSDTMGSVPKKFGGFDWIRNKNGPSDRLERLGCFINTAHALAGAGYSLPSGQVVPLDSRSSVQATEVIDAAAFEAGGRGTKSLRHDDLTVMEVALKIQASGKATVAVNAASAYQVGGGVMSGGRHALEETWCTMSTLLPSLQKVQWQERRSADHAQGHLHQHIPVTSCILSPQVKVFRDTSAKGYAFQPQPTSLAGVCSIAMFNMNSRVSDSPLDAPQDFGEYCRQVKAKFRATLACLQKLRASVLVCPDVGCGVFENDPEVVGCLLGEAILEYPGDLEVVTTGKPAFFQAMRATVEADPPRPLRELAPMPPDSFLRSLPKPKGAGKGKHGAPPTVYGSATASTPPAPRGEPARVEPKAKATPEPKPKAAFPAADPKAKAAAAAPADPKAKAAPAAADPKAKAAPAAADPKAKAKP